MLTVRLPEDIEQRLNALAAQTGRSKSFYVREALLAYMEDMEDAYLAEQRYTEFVKSGAAASPLEREDVERNLDLAD